MDSKDLKIVAILAVLAVVVIAAVTVIGGGDNDKGGDDPIPVDPEPEDPILSTDLLMVCDYSISNFVQTSASNRYAPDGYEFVIVEFAAANMSDSAISLNSLYYNLAIDGATYGIDSVTYSHKSHSDAESIGPDAEVHSALVYKVPQGSDISTCTIVWDGIDDVKLNVIPMEKSVRYNIGQYTISKTLGEYTASEGTWYVQIPYVITSDSFGFIESDDVHLSNGLKIYNLAKNLSEIDEMDREIYKKTIKGTWVFIIKGQDFDKIYLNNADLDETIVV